MAKRRRTRTLTKLRQGFRIPTNKKIASILRANSKTLVIRMFLSALSLLSKPNKIKILVKLEKGAVKKRGRKTRRKSKGRRRARGRKRSRGRKRKSKTKRKSKGRRKGRTAKQRAATRKLVAFNKRRA